MTYPLTLRECPHCHKSLVDAEISEPIKQFCESGAFHSSLLFGDEGWVCPHCRGVVE
jgi:hypothetical protein